MTADLCTTFGHNLRAHRAALGLSQAALGAKFECHRAVVGAMERGERNVTLMTLEKVADGLDLEPSELLRAAPSASAE